MNPDFLRMLARCMANATLTLAASFATAADTEPSRPIAAAQDPLAGARALILDAQWTAAIAELRRLGNHGSADWNNLMGYSHRKARTPDHAAAERYYNEALRIDPRHLGALAYSGELYLAMGDRAKAEARLAALERACGGPCSEAATLRQALAQAPVDSAGQLKKP